MKKILSIFLISAMMISMFAGVTVFAATSQATGDGGTLYYKLDFENGVNDIINNGVPFNDKPTVVTDTEGTKYGKIVSKTGAMSLSTPLIESSTDRYVIAELDIQKEATSAACVVAYRDTSDRSWHNFGTDAITEWQHTILILDRVVNANGKYNAHAFEVRNGIYTDISQSVYKDSRPSNIFKEFRVGLNLKNGTDTVYIDNLELKTYPNLYEAVNSAATPETIVNAIDKYSNLKLVANLPTDYDYLTDSQKLSVASKLLNQNFASDALLATGMQTAIVDEVVEKTYLNWDFENGTLNDSVNNKLFMSGFSDTNTPNPLDLAVVKDPLNSGNKVARMPKEDWATYAQILMTPEVVKTGFTNGEFDYLTIDFKAYSTQNFPVYLQIRPTGDANDSRFYAFTTTNLAANTWHQIRSVINTVENKREVYLYNNNAWELIQEASLPSGYDFYRFDFVKAGFDKADTYYDDFKVTGYNDVITEITEASADGVANVLEVYDEIGIVELPASYASLDAAGKTALGTYIKANTTASTTVAALNEAITLYLSNDELVVLSADATATALNGLKLAVKKGGVNLASSKLVVAAYDGTELVSVKVCDVAADGTVTGLGVDISNADSVKLMLVNNTQAMTPAVKATAWK